MTPATFPNVVCWDRQARPRVTNTIALDVLPSVFHATHSPTALRRQGAAAGSFIAETEEHFLTDFLDSAHDHVLNLAIGDSGSGKSHLVRWMYFEILRRNAEAGNRYHVVLIPRSSANLHEVVAQVLRGFEGPLVQSVKRELALAHGKLTRSAARHRVLDELAFVLGDDNTAHRPGMRTLSEDDREIRRLLPDFLRDGAIRSWLILKADVVSRLGDHVAGARESVGDPEQLRWREEQLDIPPDVFKKTGSNAEELAGLLMNDPAIRLATVRLLNEAWPDVSGSLLGLQRGNLSGALVEMRKELRAQKREMVLLIEDMSVTQGVDEELLEALILRSHERPDEPLCTLRSIVGMTPEDADSLRDNIRGRLHRTVQLTVPLTNQSEDGTVGADRLTAFAARYLNAARYDVESLEAWYAGPDAARTSLPSFCVSSGCPNREACHAAFGAVEPTPGMGPVGLYPFSSEALIRLYDQADRPGTGATRTFNPRRLVGRVLDTVLEKGEATIAEQQFPPPELLAEFRLASLPADVKVRLEEKYPAAAARLRWALEFYGPQWTELPSEIALALGLPHAPISKAKVEVKPLRVPSAKPGPEQATTQVAEPVPSADLFDRWSNGERIEDRDLNRWRGWVFDAVTAAISWDTEPGLAMVADAFRRNYIHFEGQFVGTETGDVRLLTARSAAAAVALRALSRLHIGGLTPADAEAALEIAEPWIDRWATEIRAQLQERAASQNGGQPSASATALVILAAGAVVRGVATFRSDEADHVDAAFEDWPGEAILDGRTPAWKQLWKYYTDHAADLRAWVQKSLGCWKDGAVDAGLLALAPALPTLADFRMSGNLPVLPPEARNWPKDQVQEAATAAARLLPQAISQELDFCKEWLEEVDAWTGTDDPIELLKTVPATLQLAADAGVLPAGRTAEELPDRVRMLVRRPLAACRHMVRTLVEATDARERFELIAQRDAELMDEWLDVLRDAAMLLGKATSTVNSQAERLSRGANVAALSAVTKELAQSVGHLATILESLTSGGPTP